jgi:hypothetical protein
MTGGSLFLGDGMLTAGKGFGASYLGNISQTGGNITVTNTLRLSGSRILSYFYVATYNMSGGSLTALQIVLETAGTFTQSNGVIHLRQDLQIRDNGSVPSDYQMFGGSLFTSNTVLSTYPQTGHFYQNGGTHLVTNTLSIGGYAQYSLGSGTLSAPKIIISGSPTVYAQFFVSESAPPNAITNSDHMELAHAALVIPVSEQLGRVELYSASTLDFGHVAATIRFLDSHTNYWIQDTANPQRFSILNWSGSTNGGGTDRLTFGANSSALLPSQVAQIHFIDPAGFAPGTYPSQILSTGEVVPMMPPLVTAQVSGIKLVITWPGMFTLQAATNILGPFVDVTNAASPYTNSMNLPMQFFRVRD